MIRNDDLGFCWHTVKNGRLYIALVDIDVQKNHFKNEIIEDYLINGYRNESEGIKIWKKGLIRGLEFALSNSSDFWTITINKLDAPVLDSNPVIIGYTAILAFIKKTNIFISEENLDKLENFVYNSWVDNNAVKIPNFKELIFE